MTATPGEPAGAAGAFWASLALAAAVVVSTFAIAAAQENAIGKREVMAADEALKANDRPHAILHAKAAAQAMAPLSPWPEQGEQRLRAIGHDAETRGDGATALHAYGALRAAALSTLAPGISSRWRKEAEAGLVRVAAWEGSADGAPASAPKSGEPGDSSRDPAATAMRDALAEDQTLPSWPFAALCASALAFVAAALWMAFGDTSARATRIAQSVLALAILASVAVLLTN